MLRHEVYIDGSIQQDLGFSFAPLQEIHAVWFLSSPTFEIPGVANRLSLMGIDENNGLIECRFGESEVLEIESQVPKDIHWITEDGKHLYLRFSHRRAEVGERFYKPGFSLKFQEQSYKQAGDEEKDERHEYEMKPENGSSLYLQALGMHLFLYGVYPQRDLMVFRCGTFPGIGKEIEVTESKPGGFKYRNTGGAYENFYDESQELTIRLVPPKDEDD